MIQQTCYNKLTKYSNSVPYYNLINLLKSDALNILGSGKYVEITHKFFHGWVWYHSGLQIPKRILKPNKNRWRNGILIYERFKT